mgnify:CR=1 FL=1
MDKKAMYKLSYGLFVLTAEKSKRIRTVSLTLQSWRHQNLIN